MPSLPVDNESLSSKEDAYRRYFGAFKKSSPPRPRKLLFFATLKICAIAIAASIPIFGLFWLWVYYDDLYEDKWEYAYLIYRAIITFILCLSVIYVIFKHKYAKIKMMTFNATLISLGSCGVAWGLEEYCKGDNPLWASPFTTCFLDEFWFYTVHFPLTLYLSIFVMYHGLYGRCTNSCLYCIMSNRRNVYSHNAQFKDTLIGVPCPPSFDEKPEIMELAESHTTGSVYQDEEIELSLSSRVGGIENDDYIEHNIQVGYDLKREPSSATTVTYEELEDSARTG